MREEIKRLANLGIFYIFINMIMVRLKKYRLPLASGLIFAHFIVFFLAPWFHQHPGEDHAEVKGEFYHSHVSPLASHAQEVAQDHHHSPEVLHLLQGSQLLEKMQTAIAAHFGQIFTPGKFVPQGGLFVSPFIENSPPNSAVDTIIKLPPIQLARDYFAPTATGLSPPLV